MRHGRKKKKGHDFAADQVKWYTQKTPGQKRPETGKQFGPVPTGTGEKKQQSKEKTAQYSDTLADIYHIDHGGGRRFSDLAEIRSV